MPLQITCTGCQAKLKAPDTAAGKKIKCPKCQTVVSVPATPGENGAVAKSLAAAGMQPGTSKPEQWFLQTPDGSQYGPVARDELDQWFSEGRISPECQLLKQGSAQWQWAPELFPALSQLAATATSANTVTYGGTSAAASPLTPLSSASTFSDPLGSVSLGAPALSPLGSTYPSSSTTLPSFTSGTAPTPSPFGSSSVGSAYPYATSAPAGSYGGYGGYQPPSGPHPMVIVAGIFHILMGCWNAFNCLLCSIGALALMALGGAVGAAGAGNPDPRTDGVTTAFAAFGVIGGVIVFLIALLFLAYGVMQVVTAIGLFMRKQWARNATFVFAGMGVMAMLLYVAAIVLMFDISSMIGLMAEVLYVPILFLAMLLPEADRGFR